MTPKTRIAKSLQTILIILTLAECSLTATAETPRYLYALSQNSTVLINAVTKKTGVLRSLGYAPVPGSGAVAMALHPSGAFLYVANAGSNDVAAFSVSGSNGQLTFLGPNVPAGVSPSAITIDPRGQFVYVCDALSNDVFSYAINAQNGMLMPIFSVPTGGQNPASLVIDPTNTYLFVANKGSNNIAVFILNQGTMQPLQTLQTGTGPAALAMYRSGQFVYAVNEGSDNISAYALSPASGLWNPISGNFTTGAAPLSLAFTPSGTTLYVANSGSNNLSYYTVNGGSGALTPAKKKVPAGTTPSWVGVDPSGTFIFVANVGSGDVESYQVGGNGTLKQKVVTQMGPIQMATAVVGVGPVIFEPVSAYVMDYDSGGIQAFTVNPKNGKLTAVGSEAPGAQSPEGIAVDYLGRFAYEISQRSEYISGYTIDPTTWGLTPTSPATFLAEGYLNSIAIDPSGRFLFASVSTQDSNTISVYAIDQSTGVLTDIMDASTAAFFTGLATDPWGRFLFAVSEGNGNVGSISVFAINAVNGTLTPLSSTSLTGDPGAIAVSLVDGHLFAYVTNGGQTVDAFSINPVTGALSWISYSSTPPYPGSIAADPLGRFLYVTASVNGAASGYILEYSIDPTSGDLASVGTVSMNSWLAGIAVDISGHFIYVANPFGGDILVYSIDQTTGALTQTSKSGLPDGEPVEVALYGKWY
jgi:6-phosphogluconolactonase (cycloisomerase 2 family)